MPPIPPAIINIAKFVVLLGVLIFVHELGHFLLARRYGVYVKKFYLGFDIGGLKIFSFQGKETEYGIGILPLGGYVKMAGQEDIPPGDEEGKKRLEEENKAIPPGRRFDRKPLRHKAAIIAAGPIMNILLGVGLFILIARIGYYIPAYLSEPRVGWVERGMPAERAGLRRGDLILEIGSRPVEDWPDLQEQLHFSRAGEELEILVEREGARQTILVVPEKPPGAAYPQIGISPLGKTMIGEVEAGSPAAEAGLQERDILLSLNGEPLLAPTAVSKLLEDFTGERIQLEVRRQETGERFSAALPPEYPYLRGISLARGRVRWVDPGAKGGAARLKKGDRLVEVSGRPVEPEEIVGKIKAAEPGEELVLTFQRSGWIALQPSARITVSIPVSGQAAIPGLKSIGYDPEAVLTRYRGWSAIPAGLRIGVERVRTILKFFYLLATGQMGGAALGGPVMIFQLTSTVEGISEFLNFLALISINLGLINLVPIPVLDGGHLLFIGLEGVIRRPLPERFLIIAQQIGLAVIAALILLITYKDILRVLGY